MLGAQFLYIIMAGQEQGTASGVADLEKEITCAICKEYYTEPKVLPCCHYYCKGCVYKLALRTGVDKPFPCPECRVDTTLPDSKVDNLPTAAFINRMKDLHSKLDSEQAQKRVESECGMCEEPTVEAYCQQCDQFICDKCIETHQRMKMFFTHTVTTLDKLREEGTQRLIAQKASLIVCEEHRQPISLYCYDCSCLICRDCTVRAHLSHNHEFLNKAVSVVKENMIQELKPLKSMVEDLSQAIDEIRATKSEMVIL